MNKCFIHLAEIDRCGTGLGCLGGKNWLKIISLTDQTLAVKRQEFLLFSHKLPQNS